jgi:hypothetical protein
MSAPTISTFAGRAQEPPRNRVGSKMRRVEAVSHQLARATLGQDLGRLRRPRLPTCGDRSCPAPLRARQLVGDGFRRLPTYLPVGRLTDRRGPSGPYKPLGSPHFPAALGIWRGSDFGRRPTSLVPNPMISPRGRRSAVLLAAASRQPAEKAGAPLRSAAARDRRPAARHQASAPATQRRTAP